MLVARGVVSEGEVASQAYTIATSENLDDMKEFYLGMNAELILGPETVDIPKGRTRFRNQEILLNNWTVPRLKIKYPPEWQILEERTKKSTWRGVLEQLKSAFDVSDADNCPL